jgi:hypothetical protein
MDKKNKTEISFTEVGNFYNISGSNNHAPSPLAGDHVGVKLIEYSRHSLAATSVCLADNRRCLLIGSEKGVYSASWKGLMLNWIATGKTHNLINTWQQSRSSSFELSDTDGHGLRPDLSDSYEDSPVTVNELEINEVEKFNNSLDNFLEEGFVAKSVIRCANSHRLGLCSLLLADGSLAFLMNKDKVEFSDYKCSSNIHPVMLLRQGLFKSDIEGGVKQQSKKISVLVTDSDMVTTEASDLGLKSGIYERAVSRIAHMCIVDCLPTYSLIVNRNLKKKYLLSL